VTDGEVFAFDERCLGGAARLFEQRSVNRTSGSDGTGNDVPDEIAA
jgi:hypothetical protein